MGDNRGGNQFGRDPQRTALIERVDTDVLASMGAIDGSGNALRTNFLPTSFQEAMELAKLMASGTFVPQRIRNRPGDALAIVMQATRWGMDPFAVAQKVYFVNDSGIPGYEAQLIVAVLNTSGAIEGTLDVRWEGDGNNLKCFVEGRRRGQTDLKKVEQEIATIKTKNSPLWVQSPRQQLAYYTQRLWGRLYAPEVMLGVYAADELVGADGEQARRIEDARPAAPTRAQVAARSSDEPVRPREKAVVVDHAPVPAEEQEEDEEEIARRLDAQADRGYDGTDEQGDDDAGEVDDQIDDEVPHMTAAAEPEPEVQQEAAPAAINWESWLSKFDTDLGKLESIEDVNTFYASKTEKLVAAPDGIKNRARGYVNARLRALAPPQTTTTPVPTPAARRKAATKAEPAPPVEQAPAANDTAAEQTAVEDDVSPATKKADELIALFGKKETIIDLRKAKADADDAIDAMDDDNAARVTRSFRALEDKLKGPRR